MNACRTTSLRQDQKLLFGKLYDILAKFDGAFWKGRERSEAWEMVRNGSIRGQRRPSHMVRNGSNIMDMV
jgi:uncharacterized membrane protein